MHLLQLVHDVTGKDSIGVIKSKVSGRFQSKWIVSIFLFFFFNYFLNKHFEYCSLDKLFSTVFYNSLFSYN